MSAVGLGLHNPIWTVQAAQRDRKTATSDSKDPDVYGRPKGDVAVELVEVLADLQSQLQASQDGARRYASAHIGLTEALRCRDEEISRLTIALETSGSLPLLRGLDRPEAASMPSNSLQVIEQLHDQVGGIF